MNLFFAISYFIVVGIIFSKISRRVGEKMQIVEFFEAGLKLIKDIIGLSKCK